ncbi:MAG: hypothetical protein K9N51_12510 [Candidatus Pacebacteria bacterium]|nr:hypothetical protein [Candidatus Paceibacterota bacterium]
MVTTPSSIQERKRAVTAKAVLFGVLGILLIAGLAGFHDTRITMSPPLIGSHMPASPYLYIILIAFGWNLLCSKVARPFVLTTRELTVVMGLVLMACFPPMSGLFRYFQRQLTLPWYYLATGGRTEWEAYNLLEYLPDRLFPAPAPERVNGVLQLDDTVYRGFFTGLAQGNDSIGLFGWPWQAWLQPLMYWGPLILLMSLCVMSLSLIVHQQWAHHEQLSYPVAQVGLSFVRRRSGRGVPDVFRSRLFWWGFVPIFLLYLLEYTHRWAPETVPGLAVTFPNIKQWSINLTQKMPVLQKVPGYTTLSRQSIYFSIVGLAYFVSAEISLTMGLSHILLAAGGVWFFTASGTPLVRTDVNVIRSGAYVGYALILLYTGRTYYLAVLRKAFGAGPPAPHEAASVMATRLFLLAFGGFVIMLCLMGLDWFIALLFGLALMLLFLVFTRIICETGIPFMQAGWYPATLLTALLGPAALGPGPLVYIFYLGTVLCQDPRECLMPYAATSLKMADDAGIRIQRIFRVLVAGVLVALIIGFVSTTWTMYNYGAMSGDGFAAKYPPTRPFDSAAAEIAKVSEAGMLDESEALSGIGKLKLLSPDGSTVGFMVFGLIGVFLFSLLRFRFTKFPLHPVLFLVAGTFPAMHTWWAFLVGWAVKSLVVKFGGGKVYQNLKPLFVGIIAGELIAVGLSVGVDLIYFWVTGGEPPPVHLDVILG